MTNAKINLIEFTEQERQEKVKYMGYFNSVMCNLMLEAGSETPAGKKVIELMHQGLFHTPIPEMERLIKEAREIVEEAKKS